MITHVTVVLQSWTIDLASLPWGAPGGGGGGGGVSDGVGRVPMIANALVIDH